MTSKGNSRRSGNVGKILAGVAIALTITGLLTSFLNSRNAARLISDSRCGVVFPTGDKILLYKSGKILSLGKNPAGYNSVDSWLGYSKQLRGVLLLREDSGGWPVQYSVILLRLDGTSISNKSISLDGLKGKIDSSSTWKFQAERFYQIVGHGRSIELHELDLHGKLEVHSLPSLPFGSGFAGEWHSAASIHGRKVAFASPNGDIVLIDTESKMLKHVASGEGLEEFPSESSSPNPIIWPHIDWSPDGKQIAFSVSQGSTMLKILDVTSMKTRELPVWRLLGSSTSPVMISPFMVPDMLTRVKWAPGGRYVLCEVFPGESGNSYLFVADVQHGTSARIPIMVERNCWGIMPLK